MDRGNPVEWIQADLGELDLVESLVTSHDYVIHLATGAGDGWAGLRTVEIDATRAIVLAASRGSTRRVVLASTNHVAGGLELDRLRHPLANLTQHSVTDPPRPDSEYAVAKLCAEGLVRFGAERLGIRGSCIRIGCVRTIDDPAALVDDPAMAYLGDRQARERRLRSVWLYHDDLRDLFLQELRATEPFRLRFGFSSRNPEPFWPGDVLVWKGRDGTPACI